ncbi:DsbA family protein [Polyangium jinanense]|uniref:Thioredoxin domain-containing protein n=1 Tax=Polyangium jinanense TaxID=2829994 RepID=A0A9X3XC89_9BACT|nr:thioredoxin domain-containing protein [Polyangium jinanense]MDC3959234.1 thioredoxin domain-containing protein [Polyangium jinanense]MDC3987674.1 thioredoxin domain-containing protein [Polyangium jinanense]
MSRAIRSPFVSLNRSMALVAVALAAACSQAPESIGPTDETPIRPAAAPAAQEAAPEAEGCHGDKPDCDCKHAEAEAPSDVVEEVSLGKAPVRGPESAPVTLVMFADFECPFCARAEKTLRDLEQEYPGKLRIAFKHHPLKFHAHAADAARAAIAAQAQGKFWPLHDALLGAQGTLDQEGIERAAETAGLDVARLRRDMRSAETDAQLAADKAEAARLEIKGTPTFFVNGRRIPGALPVQDFRAAIDRALVGR